MSNIILIINHLYSIYFKNILFCAILGYNFIQLCILLVKNYFHLFNIEVILLKSNLWHVFRISIEYNLMHLDFHYVLKHTKL